MHQRQADDSEDRQHDGGDSKGERTQHDPGDDHVVVGMRDQIAGRGRTKIRKRLEQILAIDRASPTALRTGLGHRQVVTTNNRAQTSNRGDYQNDRRPGD